jgi:uncharacterized membrane protein YkvA (DUF1232 family)
MQWIDELRKRASALKAKTLALYFAARHPRTPLYAKCWSPPSWPTP